MTDLLSSCSVPDAQYPLPPVLTADAMHGADAYAIETYGIPGFTLMESAGRGAADSIRARFGPLDGQTVVILCGKGNNGGDGLVVARRLYAMGAQVRILLMSEPDELRDDPAHNLDLLRQLTDADDSNRLALHVFEDLDWLADQAARWHPDFYVDALLGTGLTSELREPIRSLVGWLNAQSAPVVAIDVPTGLHSDTGAALGDIVVADHTVTMAALKAGLLIGEGPRVAGSSEVVEIGIPPFVLEDAAAKSGCARLTTDAAVRHWLPERAHDAYKYSVGMALVVGGTPGYTGAPVMASRGAARIGAGYVACACPASAQPTLATKLTAIPTIALPAGDDGIPSDPAFDVLADSLDKAKALLIGPGLGRAEGTQRFVRNLLRQTNHPAVIDADGLNALAGFIDDLAPPETRWILTPHAGEFKRLAGDSVDLSDRIQLAHTYAERWNSVLLLKGMPSLIGCPDGRVYVSGTGNPAVASAGTGDVLAGCCAGLLAQGLPPEHAAVCALHIAGAAADRYARHYDPRTMQAPDLIGELPAVMNERFLAP